jgi:hypothetical protein
MTQQPGDRLASRLVGLNIQNTADENIGEIYDIILTDAGAVKAYIVSVGGFLGMGTRYVAIDPKAVTLARQDEKNWKATMNANKDQLKAAPEYTSRNGGSAEVSHGTRGFIGGHGARKPSLTS